MTTKHVACIDDNRQSRILIEDLLTAHGFSVHLYDSAESFLEAKQPFDVALLDICMPNMSGTECLMALREEKKHEQPVIAMTALALKEDMNDLKKQAFQAIITKPIDIHRVLQTVNELCQ